MKLLLYQVDAFTDKVFSGNPAAICPLEEWLSGDLMQKIAMENNLSETGFYVKKDDHFEIRWFTPTVEVDLCGHATLAASYVIFNIENYAGPEISFESRSGTLKVRKEGDMLILDFPTDNIKEVPQLDGIEEGLGKAPLKTYKGVGDYMLVYEKQADISNMAPDFNKLAEVDCRGVIVTAPGEDCDFVSRFFAPQSGINEDPVTGSAHTTLIPYWAEKLGKTEMTAHQISPRSGFLVCLHKGDRVEIGGWAVLYMRGEIQLRITND